MRTERAHLGLEHLRRLDAHLQALDVAGHLQRLVGAEVLEAVVPEREAGDALGLELLEQRLADRAVGDLVQLGVVVEDVRQVEDFEFAHAERPELGDRRREHLHRAELQRLHFLAVLVELAVRIDLDLDPALGALLGELLEVLGALALRRVDGDDVTELDDDRLLRERAAATRAPPRWRVPVKFGVSLMPPGNETDRDACSYRGHLARGIEPVVNRLVARAARRRSGATRAPCPVSPVARAGNATSTPMPGTAASASPHHTSGSAWRCQPAVRASCSSFLSARAADDSRRAGWRSPPARERSVTRRVRVFDAAMPSPPPARSAVRRPGSSSSRLAVPRRERAPAAAAVHDDASAMAADLRAVVRDARTRVGPRASQLAQHRRRAARATARASPARRRNQRSRLRRAAGESARSVARSSPAVDARRRRRRARARRAARPPPPDAPRARTSVAG